MTKGALLYEGRGKKVSATDAAGRHIVEYLDDATVYDGDERAGFEGKRSARNRISAAIMKALEKQGAPTNYIGPFGEEGSVIRELETLPIEVVCRNMASGSYKTRLGAPEGEVFPFFVIEFYVGGKGPCGKPIRRKMIKGESAVMDADIKVAQSIALHASATLRDMLREKGYMLAEAKIEMGRDSAGLMRIGDEITPDTFRAWKRADFEKIDRDRFRKDVGADPGSYMALAADLTD